MRDLLINLSKLIVPGLFALLGIFVLSISFESGQGQSLKFILAGIMMLLFSVLWATVVLGVLKLKVPKIVGYGLVPVTILLLFLVYRSIQSSIEFYDLQDARTEVVKTKMLKIREAQLAYKEGKNSFAPNFDSLVDFLRYGKVPVIKEFGNLDDSVQVAQGLARRDTTWVSPMGHNFVKTFPIDSMPYIPYNPERKTFSLEADLLYTDEGAEVPVFALSANYDDFLLDLRQDYGRLRLDSIIQVGSLAEPITTGNWRD